MRQQYHRVDDDRHPCHQMLMDRLLAQPMVNDMASFLGHHLDAVHPLLVPLLDEPAWPQILDEPHLAYCLTWVDVHLDGSAC